MTEIVEHPSLGHSLEDKASLTSGSNFWHSQAVAGIPTSRDPNSICDTVKDCTSDTATSTTRTRRSTTSTKN